MRFRRFAAAIAAASACAGVAQAAPVSYAGTLSSGSFVGTVAADSGPHGTPEQWSFWRFTAPWMADVSITVTPTSAGFDPYIAVWYGTEADTSAYVDMRSGSAGSVFVAGADGVAEWGPSGVGQPAAVSFTNQYGAGSFVLAIADHVDGIGQGALGYRITSAVPEAHTAAMLLGGLGLIAPLLRRRRAR